MSPGKDSPQAPHLPDLISQNSLKAPKDQLLLVLSFFAAFLHTVVAELDTSVGTPKLVWTGSSSDGTVTANNCVGWAAAGMNLGTRGDGNSTGLSYFDVSSPSAVVNTFPTYCITDTAPPTPVSGSSGGFQW